MQIVSISSSVQLPEFSLREWIFMVVNVGQPAFIEKVVASRAMGNASNETMTMRASSADGIVTAGAEAPSRDLGHVQLRTGGHVV